MPHKSVFCLATSRSQADQIVDQLKAARFSSDDISALFSDQHTIRDFAQAKPIRASDVAMAGACIFGIIWGVLGGLSGMAVLTMPGFGFFFAIGPVLAALSGAAMGVVVGGVAGGLISLVFPELEVKCLDERQLEGKFLIFVHTENEAETTQAEVIFADAGGQDICATEVAADSEDDRITEIITFPAAFGLKGRSGSTHEATRIPPTVSPQACLAGEV